MAIQRVLSKWAKTNVLLKSKTLSDHIPKTVIFNRSALSSMLSDYAMVYVKPDRGTFGNGVMRVEKKNRSQAAFRFQSGANARVYNSFDELYHGIERVRPKKTYLIQHGIHLLQHRKRRFDLRVMVQKNLRNDWETTGIIGRLSHPAKIVTNYHSGGTVTPFETLMSGHLSPTAQAEYKSRLRKFGLQIAQQLQTRYPGLKEIGVDVAIDDKMKPWILEVNTAPDPYIFRKLRDKSVSRKIFRYRSAYTTTGRSIIRRSRIRRLRTKKPPYL
ncbi:YheC/YheD family protein [Paenibacillus beijingensis]|uniref:Endospore coat-associated protein n=1 Tax=Paenibacillus beijingensis TaxID=1126833 RepID=A0A0D5NIT1_9BACL|nr:YheC/YheD family protein [Paenibacillus beijingensis]AJY74897.1 endospore coat-associated protein [Paenibacillus beijingensis]